MLFLALSSHGSKDGEGSVSNGMLALNNLSADDLATALRESGIKWKVIVVSACYAGKFIEPLRDDNTIVIAAAAADRTSFGCSDDRDLTYFGEAFYRDALPTASDLEAAFQKASTEIAARERAERTGQHRIPRRTSVVQWWRIWSQSFPAAERRLTRSGPGARGALRVS